MLLGLLAHEEAIEVLKLARFMVFPSQWYETFGMTIAESFACGVPVIASRMGVMEEIVTDGKTGLHFTAGDASDLVIKVDWAWTHPEEMRAMGRAARSEFESKYTAALNYQQLMNIYGRAIAEQQKSGKLVRVGETLAF
jgi:glycosyltransferase involved in cell wall biosynthesis